MIHGSIYCHNTFRFHDGDIGSKIIIVLGNLSSMQFVVVKTTSKAHGRPTSYGCHITHRLPSFYFPVSKCRCFTVPTWVCLDVYYDIDARQLLSDRMSGLVKHIGSLDNDALQDLAECAINSEDITQTQIDAILKSAGLSSY